MKVKDIGFADEMFRLMPAAIYSLQIFVPGVKEFHALMLQLELKRWRWAEGQLPTSWEPLWPCSCGYIVLNRSGNIRSRTNRAGYNNYADLEVDFGPSVPVGDFCSCAAPNLVKSFCGIGPGATSFMMCRGCGKERQ